MKMLKIKLNHKKTRKVTDFHPKPSVVHVVLRSEII